MLVYTDPGCWAKGLGDILDDKAACLVPARAHLPDLEPRDTHSGDASGAEPDSHMAPRWRSSGEAGRVEIDGRRKGVVTGCRARAEAQIISMRKGIGWIIIVEGSWNPLSATLFLPLISCAVRAAPPRAIGYGR